MIRVKDRPEAFAKEHPESSATMQDAQTMIPAGATYATNPNTLCQFGMQAKERS